MNWTHKELIKLGFIKSSWKDDFETFTEYLKEVGHITIEISGISLVEITENGMHYITVTNCTTIEDLNKLISLFEK